MTKKKSVARQIEELNVPDDVKKMMALMLLHSSQTDRIMLSQLVASYQRQVFELQAEIEIMRADIRRVCSGASVPNPAVVIVLLRPDRERIDEAADKEMAALKKSLKDRR
jgi:hypothetical protein